MSQVQDILYTLHETHKLSDGMIGKRLGVSQSYIGRVRRGKAPGRNLLSVLSGYLTEIEHTPMQQQAPAIITRPLSPSRFRQRPVSRRPIPPTQAPGPLIGPVVKTLAARSLDAANSIIQRYLDAAPRLPEPVPLPEPIASPEPVVSPNDEKIETHLPDPLPDQRGPVEQTEPESVETSEETSETVSPEPFPFPLNAWTVIIAILALIIVVSFLPLRSVEKRSASQHYPGPLSEPLASIQTVSPGYISNGVFALEDFLR